MCAEIFWILNCLRHVVGCQLQLEQCKAGIDYTHDSPISPMLKALFLEKRALIHKSLLKQFWMPQQMENTQT